MPKAKRNHESLCLLLSYPGVREQFGCLRSVLVDEWHELMGSKRGVLMELAGNEVVEIM